MSQTLNVRLAYHPSPIQAGRPQAETVPALRRAATVFLEVQENTVFPLSNNQHTAWGACAVARVAKCTLLPAEFLRISS